MKFRKGDIVLVKEARTVNPEKEFSYYCPLGLCKVVRYNMYNKKVVRVCSVFDNYFLQGRELGFYAEELDITLLESKKDEV